MVITVANNNIIINKILVAVYVVSCIGGTGGFELTSDLLGRFLLLCSYVPMKNEE